MSLLPAEGLVDLVQIIGAKGVSEEQAEINRKRGKGPKRVKPGTPGVIPVGSSSWWAGVQSGRYPRPVKIGRRTFWRVEDIRSLIASA